MGEGGMRKGGRDPGGGTEGAREGCRAGVCNVLHTPSSGSREAIPHSTWPPLSLLVCSGDPCACVGWTPAHPRFPRAPRGQAILWSLPFLLGNLMLRPEAATRAPPERGVGFGKPRGVPVPVAISGLARRFCPGAPGDPPLFLQARGLPGEEISPSRPMGALNPLPGPCRAGLCEFQFGLWNGPSAVSGTLVKMSI